MKKKNPPCPRCGGPLEKKLFVDVWDEQDHPTEVSEDLYCSICDIRWIPYNNPTNLAEKTPIRRKRIITVSFSTERGLSDVREIVRQIKKALELAYKPEYRERKFKPFLDSMEISEAHVIEAVESEAEAEDDLSPEDRAKLAGIEKFWRDRGVVI